MISEALLPIFTNLGIGGFAIYIMWRMFDSNTKEREKHTTSAQLEREKYIGMVNDSQKEFNLYQQTVQKDIMTQLGKNTDAFTRVFDMLLKK